MAYGHSVANSGVNIVVLTRGFTEVLLLALCKEWGFFEGCQAFQ